LWKWMNEWRLQYVNANQHKLFSPEQTSTSSNQKHFVSCKIAEHEKVLTHPNAVRFEERKQGTRKSWQILQSLAITINYCLFRLHGEWRKLE
jgi:hypothetical protein